MIIMIICSEPGEERGKRRSGGEGDKGRKPRTEEERKEKKIIYININNVPILLCDFIFATIL